MNRIEFLREEASRMFFRPMNCTEVRAILHPRDWVMKPLNGPFSTQEQLAFIWHLEGCPHCQELVEQAWAHFGPKARMRGFAAALVVTAVLEINSDWPEQSYFFRMLTRYETTPSP